MKKQLILVPILAAIILTGCVSQKDYDALVNQNAELTSKVEALETENETLKGKVTELTGQLEQANSEIETCKESIEELKKTVAAYESAQNEAKKDAAGNTGEVSDPNHIDSNTIDSNASDSNTSDGPSIGEVAGDYYEKGKEIGQDVIDKLQNTDWGEVKKDAEEKGHQAAEFINGILTQ